MAKPFLPPRPNRHPVDELADIRETIRDLKVREAELREMMIGGECELEGDRHIATVYEIEQSRLNTKLLWEKLGPEILEPFVVTGDALGVRVKKRKVLACEWQWTPDH